VPLLDRVDWLMPVVNPLVTMIGLVEGFGPRTGAAPVDFDPWLCFAGLAFLLLAGMLAAGVAAWALERDEAAA
jgi:hypothetical protein